MTRHRLTQAGLALVLAVTAGACDDGQSGAESDLIASPDGAALPDSPAPTGSAAEDAPPSSDPPPATPAAPAPSPTAQQAPAEPSPANEPAGPASVTPASDAGAVSGNGRAILRGDRSTVVLEVDVQEGATVSEEALDHLVAQLAAVADKPGGIVLRGGNTFADGRENWTTEDLRAAAAAHRSTATTNDEVSVHVLYVRGAHVRDGEETTALGLAYSASTVALFPDRWGGLGTLLGSDRAIERAVLVHELGHLLGLVNLTYTSPIDHEDPDHPGHSSNRGSVMHHAVESTLVSQVFNGPPPDTFDDADRADLRGLQDGSL